MKHLGAVFLILLLVLFVYPSCTRAQEVDETRLEFFDKQLVSLQVGMTVSQDRRYAAFLFENKTLRIFDLTISKFVRELPLEYEEIAEIRYARDGLHLIVIETTGFRVIDLQTGEVKMTKSYENKLNIADVSPVDDVFAIGTKRELDIFDLTTFSKIHSIPVENDVFALSFHPTRSELLYYPQIGLTKIFSKKNSSFIFDYNNGEKVTTLEKVMMASYDATGEHVIGYYVNIAGYYFFHYKPGTDMSRSWVFKAYTNATRRQKENRGGLDFFTKILHHGDKVIGSGGYRGFSVFQIGGGEVFTTKTTTRDRGQSRLGMTSNFYVHSQYAISDDKVLINAYGDNINQIYSVSQNKIVGNIFTDGDADYAVVSRDGRFDGSSKASEKLYWTSRKSSRKTPVSSTFERGFTPGLLLQLLDSNEVLADFDIDAEIDQVPAIAFSTFNGSPIKKSANVDVIPEFSSSQKLVTFDISITENFENVEQLKLFQNRKLIALEENPSKNTSFSASLTSSFGSQNYFYVVATSKSGIDSEKQKLVVNYSGLTDSKPRLFLVTVGINEYRNPKYNLNYAVADADAFKTSLARGASSLFDGIRHIDVRNDKFTKAGLMVAMDQVQREAREQDMFIFYYAGHGVMSEGTERKIEFFIAPYDVTQLYGKDDLLYEKAISAGEIEEASRKINAQKQVFILDACQSAGALDAVARRGAAEDQAIAKLARSTGTFWITATGSDQFATEFESLGHGIFTYSLIEALSGKTDGANPDKSITVRELTTYIEARVPELSEEFKGKLQFPSSYSFGNDFPLVVYE
ncbi:MAG: caspase family protein [Bacteroidetes bacterium]|nr:caspase family protein [Bacteroidota bacterium]MDA1119601.1 caspase family protein [Bacteroidota bacterium]